MKKCVILFLLALAGCATSSQINGTCAPTEVKIPVTQHVPAPPDIQEPAYVVLTVTPAEESACSSSKTCDQLAKKLLATIQQLKDYSDELRKALDVYYNYSLSTPSDSNNISK